MYSELQMNIHFSITVEEFLVKMQVFERINNYCLKFQSRNLVMLQVPRNCALCTCIIFVVVIIDFRKTNIIILSMACNYIWNFY